MFKKILLATIFLVTLTYAQNVKNFVLSTMEGEKIHIEVNDDGIKVKEYPKKVIILDFFGKNCPPCRAEMPILGKIQKKYKNTLQIIGLHVQEPLDIKDYSMIQNRGVNFPIADYMQGNQEFVEYISKLTGWRGSIPYLLFFDVNGTYKGYHLGMMDEATMGKLIEKMSKK
ncbi:TlpA family protein disulfide reductase [Nitrosophilus kaiyonis]|uniref:TlpA family protein disulfide reductase n=1 Tax=Nitrosophilus kaiyonis TaxID=2930200 RepID=UPI00248F60F3|nr:TlpA disulfide reductase family protein [Nitrosophilus kaiyonis]